MNVEYFILSPLLCIAAKVSQESCLNICGQLYDDSLPCQCNTACTKYGNCCNDYDKSCPKEFCVGSCGQAYNKTHRCHCNAACKKHKNCCDDYDVFCLLRVNKSSTTEYTKSETTFITSVNKSSTTEYTKSETTFITSEFFEESTSGLTTSLSKDTVNDVAGIEKSTSGIIAGVTVSLTVVMLIVVVILALVYRKMHPRKQLLSKTVGNGKRTSNINYYTTENDQEDQYHDINISDGDYCLAAAVSDDTGNIEGAEDGDTTYARAISGVYDELNRKDKRKIPKVDGSKSEIYTLTSNLTVNHQTKDNNSSAKWQTPDAVDSDPTYNHSNNVIVREDLSNYDHFSNQ